MRRLDLTGQRFGRLIVRGFATADPIKGCQWNCACDCGKIKTVKAKHLRNGGTKSCGCLHIEHALKNVSENKRHVGFERLSAKGYVEIKTANGFRRKHVFVMESHIGRRLEIEEVVHHKDRNKLNNEIANLELMTHADHTILHNKERW